MTQQIVVTAALAGLQQTGTLADVAGDARLLQRGAHGLPLIGRITDLEVLDRGRVDAALLQIARTGAVAGMQRAAKSVLRDLVRVVERLRTAGIAAALLRHLDAVLPASARTASGKERFSRSHQEPESVAALTAAEALERAAVGSHDERRSLLVVEGTQAFVVAAGGLEAHEAPNQVD